PGNGKVPDANVDPGDEIVPVPEVDPGNGKVPDANVDPGDGKVPDANVYPGEQIVPGDKIGPSGGLANTVPEEEKIGPNRQAYEPDLPRDKNPDEFGPNRRLFVDDGQKVLEDGSEKFYKFGENQGKDSSDPQPVTPESKTVMVKQSMTVDQFARMELGDKASDADLKTLSDKIISGNAGLDSAVSVIQAGQEISVPGDLVLAGPDPDNKQIRMKQSMTVDAFSRSQLGESASDDDVQALIKKIVTANDGLTDGNSVIAADSLFKVPKDLELKPIEADHKMIKLKQDMSVEDFARSQLDAGATDDDVRALSQKIVNANDSLANPQAIIEAGREVIVPSDMEVKAIEADHKLVKLKESMSVLDFARSQLPDGTSDDDVRALSEKIVGANDSLADGNAIMEAGKEIKIPRELELRAIDKSYEVKPGDNLWNIAKGHLLESSGTKPTNAEVLSLVNKLVERNEIANPDLIYPDQKIVIPGEIPESTIPEPEKPEETRPKPEAPEEVEPPEETTPPEPEASEEKQKLLEAAEQKFQDNPGKFDTFKADM
ncbi:MAG: LysM domain-containing protein, partial [Candidatus Obscuribacterales bacterium]|nr:LysM domain-containing protein [Candidatus Obscuribacterales bacterium]